MRTGLCTSGRHGLCAGTVNRGTTAAPRLADCSCSCHRRAGLPVLRAPGGRAEALERAGYACEARTPGCRFGILGAGQPLHLHHKLRRGQGGTDDLDNLLVVEPGCHDYIHANPEESYRAGWLIRASVASGRYSDAGGGTDADEDETTEPRD